MAAMEHSVNGVKIFANMVNEDQRRATPMRKPRRVSILITARDVGLNPRGLASTPETSYQNA